MKISEHWLRTWINSPLEIKTIAEKLTMAGIEVENLTPVAEMFSKVIIGKVLHVEKHPQADRLKVCLVDVGRGEQLTIVCGASNVRPELIVAVALENAELPGNFKIKRSVIRGVTSHGMLCSAKELKLSEESEGIYELSTDAPIGVDFWEYLNLSDYILDVSITPNRGDCLSVLGLSREISALTQAPITPVSISAHTPALSDKIKVQVKSPDDCPRYIGRIIRNVKADAQTPLWIQERLRRSNIRCISPIVDVMNYVMIELGQPMHAFDFDKIAQEIQVRKAYAGEKLHLLDDQTVELNEETLIIADSTQPLAIAGVMGGMDSAVTLLTKHIFLESAYFNPTTIAKAVRHYYLNSESSHRFERGIDTDLQNKAIERATELLLSCVGGEAGPLIEAVSSEHLPQVVPIVLRASKANQFLGIQIDPKYIEDFLKRLGFQLKTTVKNEWQVIAPTWRSDIKLEVDLIEEIARLYGYENIPESLSAVKMQILGASEQSIDLNRLRHLFCDLGYHEIVTYSFIDPNQQQLFDPTQAAKALINPITSEMAVMRTSLWPGLVNTLLYNLNRQQHRIRLFESGLRFLIDSNELKQEFVISGLIHGNANPEQWGLPPREVDFFDLKGDIENVLKLTHNANEFHFKSISHPALHPGQSAGIYLRDEKVGIMGALHPALVKKLDLQGKMFVFELLLTALNTAKLPQAKNISKFPEIRRDIAILIDKTIPSQAIQDTIASVVGDFLQEVILFDVYESEGMTKNKKSIALALTLQHSSRTLVDEEVADIMERVVAALKNNFAAELRG